MPRRRQDIRRRTGCFQCKGLWTKHPRPKGQDKKPTFRAQPLNDYINRWVFLNVTTDDLKQSYEASDAGSQSARLESHHHFMATPTLQASTYHHPLHSFPDTDAYLLDYFIRGISPSCSLSTSHNPYISLIIPLSFVSETLRNALLAVAANQICLLGRPQFRREAYHYKDKALQGLRREIHMSLHDEGTVATVLMLCFQDISDGCSPSWMTHLRGGLKLMNSEYTQTFPSLWKFFRMYFVAHDIMSRTAFDDCEGDGDESLQLWSDGDDLEEIDVLMGCSRGLMSIIHEISVLASRRDKILKHRPLNPSETNHYTTATTALHTSLFNLIQTLPPHSSDHQDHILERIAHIKRLAAILYLTERLGSCVLYDSSHSLSKSSLITSLIESISTLPTPNKATLLWPLFVLGNASLENEEHRRFVLDRLTDIQQSRNLGSVRRTIEAVKYAFGVGGLEFGVGVGGDGEREMRGWGWGWACGGERLRFISLA